MNGHSGRDAGVDVDAARAGGLRPSGESVLHQYVPARQGDHAHGRRTRPRAGIEIHAQLVGVVHVLGAHGPGIEIYAVELGHVYDVGGVPWHQQVGASAGREAHGGVLVVDRCRFRGPFLEERLAPDALRPTFQHGRSTLDSAQRALPACQEMLDDIQLGPAFVGEEYLARMADAHVATADV